MEYELIRPIQKNYSTLEQILTNRGFQSNDIEGYLNVSEKDIISPLEIANIKQGAQLLLKHIKNNSDVLIQVDSDCDGFTSAAVLINYLNCLFPAFINNHISYRLHEGKNHGIIYETIPENVKLVIAPDSSSNDYEVHRQLKERGCDVLVIDHHEADFISEYACVINNQLCDYPNKTLSGVGMVYKFCSYIDSLLNIQQADTYLDLVMLGLVGDMMDLKSFETRYLVQQGIKQVNNRFLKAMIEKQEYSLKDGVTPMGIAFYIVPLINATIRVGTMDEKKILFEAFLDTKGNQLLPSTKRGHKEGETETLITQVCRNCSNIKNRQTRLRDLSLAQIEKIIADENLLEHKILAVRLSEPVDKNLTGLIANQLASKYQKPVLLLNKTTTDGEVCWEGSGRNCSNTKIESFREFLIDTNYVMYAEGHGSAFGAGIKDKVFDEFVRFTDEALKDFNFSPNYKVDFIFKTSDNDFQPITILEIAEAKELWGQGISEPLIALEKIHLTSDNVTLMSRDRSPTLKITLPNGITLIKFSSSEEEYNKLKVDGGKLYLDMAIVGRCAKNVWNGTVTPQIIVEDYEIADVKQYYF